MTLAGPRIDPDDVPRRLHSLFEAARSADEFELACTLLRVRGLQDAGWDPFVETQMLVGDLTALIGAPLQGHTQIRLGLLLYSHLTEVDAVYEMLANLANVIAGERYSTDPFISYYPRNRAGEPQFLSTPRKLGVLKEMLLRVGPRRRCRAVRLVLQPCGAQPLSRTPTTRCIATASVLALGASRSTPP